MQLPFDQPPASLCIVRLSAIGDTCHTVPVVRAIQDAWPSTKLTWIVGKTEHSLLAGLEGVEFVVLDKAQGLRGYAAVHRALGRPKVRRAAAHARVDAREHREHARARAAAHRLRPRARARPAMAVHEHEAAGAAAAPRHGRPVRVRGAHRRAATREPALGHPRRRRRPRGDRAAVREGRAHARDQPVHGPAISQLPQLARGLVRQVADYAAQRYGAYVLVTGGNTADRADLRPRHRGRGPFSGPRT